MTTDRATTKQNQFLSVISKLVANSMLQQKAQKDKTSVGSSNIWDVIPLWLGEQGIKDEGNYLILLE